jgi:serine/threonine protein kinase
VSSEQKICPTCGTEYPLSERFCPRDGTALRSSNAQADLLGSIVADRYHILKKLGEGGMGTVYLAEHVKMGRKSALKVMNPGMNTDADAIARFNREASNASRLSHPNICGIYDFGETSDGLIYLAMEFIEGSSLTSLIEKTGALPAARCGSIIHQTSDALQVAHDAGIVHRDLKPDNIMVTKNRDGSDLVKVVDFGIAKASSSDAQKVTKTGLVVGTPEYMSPEQLAGDKLDGRSDIYSLGLVAFNCLTGKLPFPAETVQEAMIMRLTDKPRTLAETAPGTSWPAELQATMDKALQRDATVRYQSAAQFGREFAAAISAMPATQAMEAGTAVMSAPAAAGREVPKTRVRESQQRTVPVEAASIPERKPSAPRPAPVAEKGKSKMPMILGGSGALVAAAVAAFMIMNKPETPAGNGPVDPAAGTQTAAPPGPTGDTTRFNNPNVTPPSSTTGNPDPGAANNPGTKTATPNNPPTGNATDPRPPRGTNPPANRDSSDGADEETSLGRSPADIAARVTAIRDSLENGSISDAGAREIMGRMQRVRNNRRNPLGAAQKAETWYVEMMAAVQLENDQAACRAARQVIALHPNEQRRGLANTVREGRDCTP